MEQSRNYARMGHSAHSMFIHIKKLNLLSGSTPPMRNKIIWHYKDQRVYVGFLLL